jgi:hypothetical protein
MASVQETSGAKTPLGASLADGLNTISLNQTITFTLYVKLVLPLDGYVFWVNAALLTDSAIYNATQYNRLEYDQPPSPLPRKQITIQGSLHYTSEVNQLEDRTAIFSNLIFTALEDIVDFKSINPQIMYIANYEDMKFSFNRRENFYKQADLYHYRGSPLYSIMDTQIIDTMTGFDTTNVIVSNSLPIWLTLTQYFPMLPSFLVDQNLPPPYAAVDIDPRSTQALQSAPLITLNSSHYQLVKETVKITIYGTRNYNALEFQDYVFQYSLDTDNIGLLNMPVIQDEKVTQSEFGIIAMKKSITFEISYYQKNLLDIARKLIEHAFIDVSFSDQPQV